MGSRLEKHSDEVRKRIQNHEFTSEKGEEYESSSFGGFRDYMRRKKIKLQNLDAETRANSSKPQIFKGIVCHINGYTQPSLNDLHTMIVQHGGGFLQYLEGKTACTHIIASNLTPKKKDEFRRYRIVKPAWIVDSVREGRLLPWNAYRVVDEGAGQKVLGMEHGVMTSQRNVKALGYRDQTDTSWYTEQLKAGSSRSPPSPGQVIPKLSLSESIEDDEFPLPTMTSSDERALGLGESSQQLGHVGRTSPVRSELQTPPPSSQPSASDKVANNDLAATAESYAAPLVDELPAQSEEDSDSGADKAGISNSDGANDLVESARRETEYGIDDVVTHAVVRNSDILRAISPAKIAQMTAEEHNALLLSDPKIRKSTVVDPGFLDQYYRESRLHHLSTWKADLKSQLQALANEKSASQQARDARAKVKKIPWQRRYILHVDFDSFFAAVSLKKYPELVDKPCVVAHGSGSGSEIASCNYPARKFGIANGMWMKRAQELCPHVKVLPYDFPAYEDASRKFYSAIMATDGVVQSVSIDEALVDISSICISFSGSDGVCRGEGAADREQFKADEIAENLRAEVLRDTGCHVSVGIGGNILLAKVALRKAKPAGQYHLKPEEVLDFIGDLEVKSLPGVAWSIGGKLEEIGIKFVKDIREVTKDKLISTLGPKTGEKIYEYSRGIDRAEVGDQVIRKSVSAEVNWGVRFATQEQVDEFMHGLCGELHKRLVKEGVKGRQLTMKVMRRAADAPRDPPKHLGHGKCDTLNKSIQLGVATNETSILAKDAIAMLKSFNISPGELRGIGVQMQKLDPIKSAGDANTPASSQRKLQFKPPAAGLASKSTTEDAALKANDPIQDDIHTPQKSRVDIHNQPSVPIKPATRGTPSKKPLNTLGTQFILPTQVDPTVLAELPDDIRAKLARHMEPQGQRGVELPSMGSDSEPTSRALSPVPGLPPESQLDPAILASLPDDVKQEVMAFYKSPRKDKSGQTLLPQSPRKPRSLPPTKQTLKRKRGGGLLSGRSKAPLRDSEHSTLTQSNFVSRSMNPAHPDADGAAAFDSEIEEIDQEFLAALPEDMRAEVLDQHRQARLQRTGGIDLSLHQRPNKKRKTTAPEGPLDRLLHLPPRPPKPTFTSRKLSELPDLRDAITAWHGEFGDEAPFEEDVDALCTYLRDVVLEEGDMGKAVAVARWMQWVVEGDGRSQDDVGLAWDKALEKVKGGVQAAVAARGLGKVDLG